jgi:hypothetical protein
MSHFNQYHETPKVRTDGESVNQQETDQVGNQKVTLATQLSPDNHGVQSYPDDYLYRYIATATTTTVKAEAGYIKSITLGETAAGAITVYDNTAGSGTIIAVLKASVVEGTYELGVKFNTGLTIVTAGASKLTVSYR